MKSLARLRSDALSIFHDGLKAADPVNAVKRHLNLQGDRLEIQEQMYDLSTYEGIYLVGAGKAGAKMARAIEDLLGKRLKAGIVNVKYSHSVPLDFVRVNEAGHPLPDEAGLEGTEQIIQLLLRTHKNDLVLCLISGGGSALMPCPAKGLTLKSKQRVTELLLESGAPIQEVNAVRKHLSQIKGGRLAGLAYPSTLISLVLSDVIGDHLETIASGPTVPDGSTFLDCLHIFENYSLKDKVPSDAMEILEKGIRGEIEETPKTHNRVFRRTQNVIVGNIFLALDAAKKKADELGYYSLIHSGNIEGETRDVARVHAAIAKEILSTGSPVQRPACIISGGETTVTVRGRGLGGRNQEFALASAIVIDGLETVVVLSGGTDGLDGPTDAAGAIADGMTLRRAIGMGLDAQHYLQDNDTYHFFRPLGDLLITGPTYTNVMDLHLLLVA